MTRTPDGVGTGTIAESMGPSRVVVQMEETPMRANVIAGTGHQTVTSEGGGIRAGVILRRAVMGLFPGLSALPIVCFLESRSS